MYIGPQGIVHGTFNTILNAGRLKLGIPDDGDLRGHMFVSSGLGGMSGAQPKAVEISGGVGIIADVMTDNKNRISSEMRIATNKCGGSVASPGSVAFNFDRKGMLKLTKQHAIEDELFLAATEAGAEDFDIVDDMYVVVTDPADLMSVKEEIEKLGFRCDEESFEMIPKVFVDVDEETAKANKKLIEWLEDLDDVDAVYHNMNIEE